ncbi:glycosyltransferase family 4 protein [Acuticoccus sp. MNP-M23]|uniref:glycosyltransferase family 4 protein n=1 Tax=Acuticoccus sp. MNP-M23 TaxID=3072793 RepID=UPI002815E940|nr:glycosyltransferase family 4 protein [Acuticoccus sp. MNP-M23]WMS44128.1 glycosyltransferase family 4 protein [Acuticoccus sp. MNP-M23]
MSARPMTVLQVLPSLETGGAERTTIDVAAALVAKGDRAIVVSEGGRMVDELLATGAEHVEMPVATKAIFGLRRNAARLAALMEKEDVDIIHARSRAPAWSALWAASWTYRPLVTTYHGAYNEKTAIKNRYNSVMARGDIVIANSAYTAALIGKRHRFAADRIITIPRGIDLSSFEEDAGDRAAALRKAWKVEPADPVILHLARLTPWKGQEVLLDALAILQERYARPFVCVMAGDDQGRTGYRERLVARTRAMGLTERVRIVGHVSDVPGAMAATSVSVVPSVEPEAFGRAAVEAQAAGVPVVVSDHGAVRETVLAPPEVPRDRRTGWRVPPGDAPALAEALFSALQTSRDIRETIGIRGRAHALTHFSLDAMNRKTLGVYHSLLEDDVSALY